MLEFTEERISFLKDVNSKLKINDDLSIERNRTIVFVYCPPKVGSTTLVSSLRLSQAHKLMVVHVHNETMLKVLCNIENVKITEIIEFNKYLGKTVYVIDIYRNPIEQKMSLFFEDVENYHFNTDVETINTYNIQRIIRRFNCIFPHLANEDYYRTIYNIQFPESFSFSEKYTIVSKNDIKYIKLRLQDSHEWQFILRQITGLDIKIVKDYETESKELSELYKRFKSEYRIPSNLLKIVEDDERLDYYTTKEYKSDYIRMWRDKEGTECKTYNLSEYMLYKEISVENQKVCKIQRNHYLDVGCMCRGCSKSRMSVLEKVSKGESIEKIIHKESSNIIYYERKSEKVVNRPKNILRRALSNSLSHS